MTEICPFASNAADGWQQGQMRSESRVIGITGVQWAPEGGAPVGCDPLGGLETLGRVPRDRDIDPRLRAAHDVEPRVNRNGWVWIARAVAMRSDGDLRFARSLRSLQRHRMNRRRGLDREQ